MTVPPGARSEASGDSVATPAGPGGAAFGLLSRAQALADQLRSEVEVEVAALRADARAAHDEAKQLLVDANNVRDDALSAQRSAQARLQEAQQDAAQLVEDASDQATLVASAADRASESLLAKTRTEADEIRNTADAEGVRLRGLATTELDKARESCRSLLSEATERTESLKRQVTEELEQLGAEATANATTIRAAAEESCGELISRANTEAGEPVPPPYGSWPRHGQRPKSSGQPQPPRSTPLATPRLPRPIGSWALRPTICTGPRRRFGPSC